MGYFDWDRKYEVGVDEMDNQHKRLIALMNRLHEQNESKAGRVKLLGILSELGALTTRHFKEEEHFMASVGYADLESHKIIHEQLLGSFQEHFDAFKNSNKPELPTAFFTFLKLWLSSHILGIDARYGEYTKRGAA